MSRAQSPIKVHESTTEKVRYAALMSGLQQAQLVERAVDEYVERHREEFGRRMERAREALLGGKASALAYVTGVSEEDVARVGGVAVQAGSRKPKRATTNQASSPKGQSGARFYDLRARGVEDKPEEHVAASLVGEAAVCGLSRERDPELVAGCRRVQPHVDELADAKGDVPAAAGGRVGERSRDRGSRPIVMRALRSSASRRRSSSPGSSRPAP